MMVVIAGLLLASFISCMSAGAEKPKISDGPVLTIGYLLYEPKVKDAPEVKDVTWELKFNSSLEKIHKYAEAWLRRYIYMRFKLQTWKIMQVDETMKSKLDSLKRNGTLVDPYKALEYVKDNETRISNRPNILCLVTQKPLTVYTDGFGLYYRLCKDVVPLILTYNQTSDKATGEKLGFLIQNTLNITNLHTWYYLSDDEKKRHFEYLEYTDSTEYAAQQNILYNTNRTQDNSLVVVRFNMLKPQKRSNFKPPSRQQK